ncbi:MAG: pentapeptide repeat-containing protein [Spirulinaceae cyanobacterium RM2_2_10]|nr:pentapeptide repeat-containing protein [Spirulinaceae cyanobacterium RM2_2_10]
MRKADLQVAILRGTNLESANLRNADLQYADLRDANLRGANFQGADLQGSHFGRNPGLTGAQRQKFTARGAVFDDVPTDCPDRPPTDAAAPEPEI